MSLKETEVESVEKIKTLARSLDFSLKPWTTPLKMKDKVLLSSLTHHRKCCNTKAYMKRSRDHLKPKTEESKKEKILKLLIT